MTCLLHLNLRELVLLRRLVENARSSFQAHSLDVRSRHRLLWYTLCLLRWSHLWRGSWEHVGSWAQAPGVDDGWVAVILIRDCSTTENVRVGLIHHHQPSNRCGEPCRQGNDSLRPCFTDQRISRFIHDTAPCHRLLPLRRDLRRG